MEPLQARLREVRRALKTQTRLLTFPDPSSFSRAGRRPGDDAGDLGLANPARAPGPWTDKFKTLAPQKASKPRQPKDSAKPAEPGAGT